MDRPKFLIEASEAKSMASESNLSIHELLPVLVGPAQTLARPPISKFPVGAVGLGGSGRIFVGVNLEFPGLPLHHSVHAEQCLVTNLAIHGEETLTHLAVSAAPCGHCRQFLQELRTAPDLRVLIVSDPDPAFSPLSGLLPSRFGPDDLLDKDVPLALEPRSNGLRFKTGAGLLPNGTRPDLRDTALRAADVSHAPYSKCPSGVALMDDEGRVYAGSYVESAAYNPSLGPVQAALVHYVVAGGGGGYERIVSAVLVELEDAVVRHEPTARLLLQVVSPKCELKVFNCCFGSNCIE